MRRKLYTGQPGTSSAAAYTSTNTTTTITAATVTNPTAGAVTLNVWLVPASASATDANKIYHTFSVAAGATTGLSGLVAQTLDAGGAIHASASAATSLTLHISGDVG